jgi:hypothetical protein
LTVEDLLLKLLARFRAEGVEYVLVGGQAVRLNGYLRATEDVDVLVKATRENGRRIRKAMDFLTSAGDIEESWFEAAGGTPENIRVADDLIVDLLFAANGETYESVREFVREIVIDSVPIRVLNIDGLLRTKTDYREKDILDKRVLARIKQRLDSERP